MNGMYGFDATEIYALRGKVKRGLGELEEVLSHAMQIYVLDPLMENWYAQEAVEAITSIAHSITAMNSPIISAYNAYLDAIAEIVKLWGASTKDPEFTENFQYAYFGSSDFSITVSYENASVRNSMNQSGMNYQACLQTAGQGMTTARQNIKTAITQIQAGLTSAGAFLGGTQEEKTIELFKAVGNIVDHMFSSLTDGEDSLRNQINKYAQKYDALREQAEQAMENATTEINANVSSGTTPSAQ
ncbi:MAG: hypothetical protein IKO49_04895 [Bacilli bacterium]|nr:hypothetical protein [Bacilli bacterium]